MSVILNAFRPVDQQGKLGPVDQKKLAITLLGITLIAAGIALWVLIGKNQTSISQTEHKIHQLQDELWNLDIDNHHRFFEIITEWKALSDQLHVLKNFPTSILLPVASVATAFGVGFTTWGIARTPKKVPSENYEGDGLTAVNPNTASLPASASVDPAYGNSDNYL